MDLSILLGRAKGKASVRKLVIASNGVTIVEAVRCAPSMCPLDSLTEPSW